ncbi:hypothetical protein RUM43_015069, partial [Polyplax serrata]
MTTVPHRELPSATCRRRFWRCRPPSTAGATAEGGRRRPFSGGGSDLAGETPEAAESGKRSRDRGHVGRSAPRAESGCLFVRNTRRTPDHCVRGHKGRSQSGDDVPKPQSDVRHVINYWQATEDRQNIENNYGVTDDSAVDTLFGGVECGESGFAALVPCLVQRYWIRQRSGIPAIPLSMYTILHCFGVTHTPDDYYPIPRTPQVTEVKNLTRVRPHKIVKDPWFIDHYAKDFLKQLLGSDIVSEFGKYSRSYYTEEGHYHNLWKYDSQ